MKRSVVILCGGLAAVESPPFRNFQVPIRPCFEISRASWGERGRVRGGVAGADMKLLREKGVVVEGEAEAAVQVEVEVENKCSQV